MPSCLDKVMFMKFLMRKIAKIGKISQTQTVENFSYEISER